MSQLDHIEVDGWRPPPGLPPDMTPIETPDQRIERVKREANAAGFHLPETILPEGHALWDSGREKLTADRKRWARMARVGDGALKHVQAVNAAEQRIDVQLPVNTLILGAATARLYRDAARAERDGLDKAAGGLGYTDRAFRQLVDRADANVARGAASTFLALEPDERAAILNRRLKRAPADNVLLRTKRVNGGVIARAVLSERYAACDDADVAAALDVVLGRDADVRLDYLPGEDVSRMEAFWPSDVAIDTVRVGDIHKAAIIVENSETGSGSLRVRPALLRILCANLTVAWGEGIEISLRHLGDRQRLVGAMKAAVQGAALQIQPMVGAITRAARNPAPDKPIGDLFAAIARKGGATPERAKAWAETFDAKYSDSRTLWGVTSAITEAAQTGGWWVTQAEEERIAGELLAQQWQYVTR